MKAGIMQPYLFPYIGYFQLIHAVDAFVIYDDVQYITRGWINRNRFLQNEAPHLYTFSLQNDSSRKDINERYFTANFKEQCSEFLKMIQFAYGNAPYFEQTKTLVKQVFEEMNPGKADENIAIKIGRSIKIISDFLNLNTRFLISSKMDKDNSKSGQNLILEINRKLESEVYINPIKGRDLYSHERFKEEGIELFFIKPDKVTYNQFTDKFVPWLSIIDVCMFNHRQEISKMLESYSLVR